MYRLFVISIVLVSLLSCNKANLKKSEPENLKFNKVLILGNSITYHAASSNLGWNANWGMAASVRDSDFVHILNRNFQSRNSKIILKAINLGQFESEYESYNLNSVDSLRKFNPDLLILRLGENVIASKPEFKVFSRHYTELIRFFKMNNQNIRIICVSNFWRNPLVEDIIKECAKSENVSYVSLSHLDEAKYTAWGLFNNPAVGSHPGNKGMNEIANLIWNKTLEINKQL